MIGQIDLLQALILGIVEGATEFLPISSTGHLIVVGAWLGVGQTETKTAFDVIIQLAAILAVIATCSDKFSRNHLALWGKVLMAFVPIGIVGFLGGDLIESFFSVPVVASAFIVGGVIFLVVEWFQRGRSRSITRIDDLSWTQAAWIGLAQVFALIPGTSRAGATIIGALLVGADRRTSAEFSFLLALPVMVATASYEIFRHHGAFKGEDVVTLCLGFATSFIVAWIAMRGLLQFLSRFTFVAFGIYRVVFGGALLFWLG
jgi:undecaprenyl-diphosphatase